eukprot:TRINITY_DN25867_c0_g1_i1.p1 TRINITY_DN25867_c0_g1~~TRINITY_DN25867_c0_g1_i1.p1  ORF type:complete len:322 (-),score=22.28 TRINITY_DN25867_c0_g1_i1:58-1023(-)
MHNTLTDQQSGLLPLLRTEDLQYYIIYDPRKRIFMPSARLTSQMIFAEEKPKLPESYNLLAREPCSSFFTGISGQCVSVFYYYYDVLSAEYCVKARLSGVAVSPTHVLTIAHFPEKLGLPSYAIVTSDDFADWKTPYLRSAKGKVITPEIFDREAPVLVELEEPFFQSFLRPSFRIIPDNAFIYAVVYNGEVSPNELQEQYLKQVDTAKEERNIDIPEFMCALSPFAPTVAVASSLLYPSNRTVTAGTVLGSSKSGNSVYVSFSVSGGSSGGPVFFSPFSNNSFDGIVFGACSGYNGNIIISSSSPKFKAYWGELERHLPK